MDGLVVILIPLAVVLIWFVATYNSLVRGDNHCDESWAGIDTELKRRYDLIPNLVETVKGYASHERDVLDRVVAARSAAVSSTGSPVSQAADENALVRSLRQLLAVVENYPELKAAGNFLALQRELVNTEDRIQRARRFYNANVRDLNNRVESIPSNLVARLIGKQTREYFEIESAIEREAPKVDLG